MRKKFFDASSGIIYHENYVTLFSLFSLLVLTSDNLFRRYNPEIFALRLSLTNYTFANYIVIMDI